MREWIDLMESAVRYDSKPSYFVPIEGEEDSPEHPVWRNPSRNTFHRMIAANYGDIRGIIYKSGDVLIWDKTDLVHSDVYDYLESELPGGLHTAQFRADCVSVKGDTHEPISYEGDDLEILQAIVKKYYPEGVKFDTYNWN